MARTIAQVLVCEDKRDGYLEEPDGAVSWCFGHLAEYAMPEAYDERYRKWSLEALPIIPERWKLEVTEDKARQFKTLRNLLNSNDFSYVVNACDAGREGELIFNRVYELSGSSDMEADVERKGLGTPATRASIIDKLICKEKKVLAAYLEGHEIRNRDTDKLAAIRRSRRTL